ncbi:hypothetical protein D9M68_850090 [compost metagenome]
MLSALPSYRVRVLQPPQGRVGWKTAKRFPPGGFQAACHRVLRKRFECRTSLSDRDLRKAGSSCRWWLHSRRHDHHEFSPRAGAGLSWLRSPNFGWRETVDGDGRGEFNRAVVRSEKQKTGKLFVGGGNACRVAARYCRYTTGIASFGLEAWDSESVIS